MNIGIFIRTIAGSVWQLSAGLGQPAAPRQPASNKQSQEEAVERRLKLPLAAFRGKATRNFIQGRTPAKFQQAEDQIWETLEFLDRADSMLALRRIRGLRFEKLHSKNGSIQFGSTSTIGSVLIGAKKSPHPTNIEITNHYDN